MRKLFLSILMALGLTTPAFATCPLPGWELNYFPEGNQASANIHGVLARYNPNDKSLHWLTQTTSPTAPDGQPNGFVLVVTPGPNPNPSVDKYAILYGDAIHSQLTAYVYDSSIGVDSWESGEYIASYSGVIGAWDEGNQRSTEWTIDTTAIKQYGADNDLENWKGSLFGSKIGFWYQPLWLTDISYTADNRIASLNADVLGFYQGSNLETMNCGGVDEPCTGVIPEPATMALMAAGLSGMGLARRRKLVK